MKTITTLLVALGLLLLPRSSALAWSGAGHMAIAAEAYHQLSPELQTKVNEILKSHPDYAKWTNSFTTDSTNLDLATFIFMRSATWADEIRRSGSEYDHPHWHYIDYPARRR